MLGLWLSSFYLVKWHQGQIPSFPGFSICTRGHYEASSRVVTATDGQRVAFRPPSKTQAETGALGELSHLEMVPQPGGGPGQHREGLLQGLMSCRLVFQESKRSVVPISPKRASSVPETQDNTTDASCVSRRPEQPGDGVGVTAERDQALPRCEVTFSDALIVVICMHFFRT